MLHKFADLSLGNSNKCSNELGYILDYQKLMLINHIGQLFFSLHYLSRCGRHILKDK